MAGVANENFHAFSVLVEINQDYYCQNLRLCTGDGRIPDEGPARKDLRATMPGGAK